MATTRTWRKGRWQYSTSARQVSYRECPVCKCETAASGITNHLNAHVRRGECERHEYNGQIVYRANGLTVYVKG